jgi:thioredoxin 1
LPGGKSDEAFRRHRVLLAAGILAGVMLGSLPAIAADWKPFTQADFSAAQKDGKPILVDIFAPWCPTCRAQKPILEELTAKPEFKDLVVLVVNFDQQTDDVRALKAQSQSTLIAYKGAEEVALSAIPTPATSKRSSRTRSRRWP